MFPYTEVRAVRGTRCEFVGAWVNMGVQSPWMIDVQ